MNNILLLWDIDGNLVNVYKHHNPAYQKAIEKIYGIKLSFQDIEQNYGLPAREVIAIPVRKKGVSKQIIKKGMNQAFSIYSEELEKRIKIASKGSEVILPGVLELLKKFKFLKIPMGIVTGNIKKAGEAIIKGSNLYDYFDPKINSYGDNVTHRYEIVSTAINQAKENGLIGDETKIYAFGDTPADVEAAKKNNCVSIAVIKNSNDKDSSPGGYSYHKRKESLEKSNPDFLFDDYTNLREIMSIMGIN